MVSTICNGLSNSQITITKIESSLIFVDETACVGIVGIRLPIYFGKNKRLIKVKSNKDYKGLWSLGSVVWVAMSYRRFVNSGATGFWSSSYWWVSVSSVVSLLKLFTTAQKYHAMAGVGLYIKTIKENNTNFKIGQYQSSIAIRCNYQNKLWYPKYPKPC